MAKSWIIVDEDGVRRAVDIRAKTTEGVRKAARRALKNGQQVIAAYVGGPRAIALCKKVYPS